MTRKDKILCHINKDGMGIEIGPFQTPVALKREGFRVHIIDHTDKQGLIENYKSHIGTYKGADFNFDNIEEVDFIWNGESYSELTGKTKFYDWIIASHLIEHTPDFIGFINECDSILKDDGVLSLAV